MKSVNLFISASILVLTSQAGAFATHIMSEEEQLEKAIHLSLISGKEENEKRDYEFALELQTKFLAEEKANYARTPRGKQPEQVKGARSGNPQLQPVLYQNQEEKKKLDSQQLDNQNRNFHASRPTNWQGKH